METKQYRTMCPMNCHPTLCGMKVSIEAGRVTAIEGDPEHPDSQGFLCLRGHAAKEIIDNPKRLLKAKVRANRNSPQWNSIEWSDAMNKFADQLQNNTPESFGIWLGHGDLATNYGTRLGGLLSRRFAHLYGANWWHPAMVCWGLGAFGLGLTGALAVNTKEDMGENSDLIILWGVSMASQPNTIPHLKKARERGAQIISIDVRKNETSGYTQRGFIIKPHSDAALALGIMHVLVNEGCIDEKYIEQHTVGFSSLKQHIQQYNPDWVSEQTGLDADDIIWLAREYAAYDKSMIVLGGSSMHKHHQGWLGPRAIACLPALTGKYGEAGSGLGPRHGANADGVILNTLLPETPDRCTNRIPDQMSAMLEAFEQGKIKTLFLSGTNMLSSFADTHRLKKALNNVDYIVCHDVFENDTIRELADCVLPATAWLEQLGCKMTNTHLYLMDKILPAPGDTHSLSGILQELAEHLSLDDFYPWQGDEDFINEVIDHPSLGEPSVANMRESKANHALPICHHAYANHQYPTPSGKIEFYSERAAELGLPALPIATQVPINETYPLVLSYGRTLTHFHGFYDHGKALPTLESRAEKPTVWINTVDAKLRAIQNRDRVRLFNDRGEFFAQVKVTDNIQAGALWIRDGWYGLNALASSAACIPDEATALFPFGSGQAAYEALVEIEIANT